MPLDQETVQQQLALLAVYRRTLAALRQQLAPRGGMASTTPGVLNNIEEACANIARIKTMLRAAGVEVADAPNDETPPQVDVTQVVGAGPRLQSTVTVQDNKGTVIGVQLHQPALTPALHQLRAPVADFVGRVREIEQLVQALSKAASGGAAAAISGVRGMGGVGKTELAYAVAQRVAEQFPDAQLLVELRGASSSPLPPEQALQTVMRAFEREAKLPDDLSQLQGLYRAVLAGKRALILADDARDVGQVRPLMPPPGCVLLVTSRTRFSLPGATLLDLGTLPSEAAERLLLEICPRIGGHAAELARLCGYLPLALRVSASLLEANDTRDVARYLAQLQQQRLQHLADPDNPDDPQASVEASLRLSYDALAPRARTALCQLSVFPTSFDDAAAGVVVAVEGDVAEVLHLLRRRSLLEWDVALERYSLHDLVRALAGARLEDADAVRLRHARHYGAVAARADQLYLQGGPHTLAGLVVFDRERTHIDVGWGWAREHAGDPQADALLLDYANATADVGDLRYDTRRERIPQLTAAVLAAQRRGERRGEGAALGNLGRAYAALGDARRAISFYEQHLTIARAIGDRRGEAITSWNLGDELAKQGDLARAVEVMHLYVDFLREIGHPDAEKRAAWLAQVRQRLAGGGSGSGGWRGWWRRLTGRG